MDIKELKRKLRLFLLKPFDWLFNRKIKRYIIGVSGVYVVGSKGAGKSTLYALAAEQSKKLDLKVFSQYPYKDAYVIPVVKTDMGKFVVKARRKLTNGKWFEEKDWIPHEVYNIDKDWLYKSDFTDCTLLLDEARTIWPNRSYESWSVSDDEFFNFLRKRKVNLFVSSQVNDCIDLNVRRAVDETWYLWKRTPHSPFTHIEVYENEIVPVANLQKSVKLSFLKKEMSPLDWEICSSLTKRFIFYRPPYYDLFDTNFYYGEQQPPEFNSWNEHPFFVNN